MKTVTKKNVPKKPQLIEGPVVRTLVRLALPMMVGIVSMVAFNLVDTFFVGRLGTLELAAMSFTFPVVLVVMSISRGLGVGATSVLARAIGEGDQNKVRRMTTDALLLSVIVVAAFVVVGLFTIEPLFRLLGADDKVLPLIKRYMSIWYVGMPFVVVPMVGNSAIRATGDTKTPSAIMIAAIIVNLTLDPMLIFGIGPFPRLELAGAALATVIARAVTLVISLLVLTRREKMLTLVRVSFRKIFKTWRQVLYLGVPAAATYIIIPLSTGIVTRLIAGYGAVHVAGFGVATRIEMFALTIIIALSVVLIPFVGQNAGAGKNQRIRRALSYSQLFSLAWGVVLFLVFMILGRPIASIFNKNPDVIGTATLYVGIASISYGAYGTIDLNASVFNGLKKPLPAAALSLIRMFALYVPLAFLGSRLLGLKGIFGGIAIANFGTAAVSTIWIRRQMTKTELHKPADVPPSH